MKYQQFAPQMLNLDLIEQRNNEGSENCLICTEYRNTGSFQQELIFKKYFDAFNFYFAKPVNEILANIQTDHVILFKDLLFYNDDNEYLKRYYRQDEVPPRMSILADFYATQYKETRPNLCTVNSAKLITKRNQKQAKIVIARFQPNESQQKLTVPGKKMLPDGLFDDNFSMPSSSHESESIPRLKISFESQSHDIYDYTQSIIKKRAQQLKLNEVLKRDGDSVRLFLKEQDADFNEAIDGLNQFANQMYSKQAKNESVQDTGLFRKRKLHNVHSEKDFLSQYATNDAYHSERSQKETVKGKKSPPNAKQPTPQTQRRIEQKSSLTQRKSENNSQFTKQILRKVYEQHLEKMNIKPKKIVLKSEQSQSPHRNNARGKRDSQSSEASVSNMKQPQKKQQYQNFRCSSSYNKIYLVHNHQKYKKQTTNNPALKKQHFSHVTHSSPSTTHVLRMKPNYSNYSRNLSKQYENSIGKMKNGTCSPSILLRSLSSNPSMTQSPARRMEIKVDLNKLIQKQEREMQQLSKEGYWTHRDQDQTQGAQTTDRRLFQKKTISQLYAGLSPLQQKLLKQKLQSALLKKLQR